jgi:hypothetical protein
MDDWVVEPESKSRRDALEKLDDEIIRRFQEAGGNRKPILKAEG